MIMVEFERNALVWGIVGNLGGGKTLSAVKLAIDALSRGWFVVSNVRLDLPAISKYLGYDVTPLYLYVDLAEVDPFTFPSGDPRGSGGRRRVVVILDELAEYFDQFAGMKNDTKHFMSWLRHSSKRSQDVIMVVQRQEYIAKSLRILVSRWIWVDDLAVFRLPKFKTKIPFCANLIMQNVFDRQGKRVQGVSFLKKNIWGRFYDTSQVISVHGGSSYIYRSPPRSQPLNWCIFFLFISILLLLFLS